jgi:serine protease
MRNAKSIIAAVFCAVTNITATEIQIADFKPAYPTGQYVEQECIVRFFPEVADSALQKKKERYMFHVLSYYSQGDFYRIKVPGGKTVDSFLKELSIDDRIQFAHPDYFLMGQSSSTDPVFRYQWNLGDTGIGGIRLLQAHNKGTPYIADVLVALIDGGVAYENYGSFRKAPELSRVSFVSGFDFIEYDQHANDESGHGTHIATVIDSGTNNSTGVAGIAPGSTLLPLKVLNGSGLARTSDVVEAIYYAVAQGAVILNISLGGPDSPLLRESLRFASERGVLSVCAAGNKQPGLKDPVLYPAAYNEYCIAVTAHGVSGTTTPYSMENDYIDCSAPGGSNATDLNEDGVKDGIIQQTFSGNPAEFSFYSGEGTSFAAAHVSAVGALIKGTGINGMDKVRQAIEQSCVDQGPVGWDRSTGWGLLDASGALNVFPPRKHDIAISTVKSAAWCIQGEEIQISAFVKNQGLCEENVEVSVYDSLTSHVISSVNCVLKPGETRRSIFVWDTKAERAGAHLLALTVKHSADEDPGDNTYYKTITVVKEHRDIALLGTEYKKESENREPVLIVQIGNNGTYSESVHVEVKDLEERVLGFASATIEAQTDTKLVITGNLDSRLIKDGIVSVIVQTSDMQETDGDNNSATLQLRQRE